MCRDSPKLPSLRAVFDPANFISCRENVLDAWDLLAPYNEYIHIKDMKECGTVVPAGEGISHMEELLRRYLANGGKVMTVEPHLSVFEGFNALEKAGEKTKIASYRYSSPREAFDTAVKALKSIIKTIQGDF